MTIHTLRLKNGTWYAVTTYESGNKLRFSDTYAPTKDEAVKVLTDKHGEQKVHDLSGPEDDLPMEIVHYDKVDDYYDVDEKPGAEEVS